MCNLYSLNKKRDMVARFFRVSHNRAVMFKPLPAIFPRHSAPVVRGTADGEREIVTMSWGFMLLQNGRAPRPVTNVRDDKILLSSFWKTSFLERRCLVPASSFCEPNGDVKPATWHWFALKGGERPLFAFPGIWRRYRGPVKKDGPNVDIETYAFLTTSPNSLVATINHERMPVMCSRAKRNSTPGFAVRPTKRSLWHASTRPRRCGSCRRAPTKRTGSRRDRGCVKTPIGCRRTGIVFFWTRRSAAFAANPGFAIRNLGEVVLRVPDAPEFSHGQDPNRTFDLTAEIAQLRN